MFARGKRYRLGAPTIALCPDETGHKVAITLPAKAVVEVLEESAEDVVFVG